jgi:hypothetical protein
LTEAGFRSLIQIGIGPEIRGSVSADCDVPGGPLSHFPNPSFRTVDLDPKGDVLGRAENALEVERNDTVFEYRRWYCNFRTIPRPPVFERALCSTLRAIQKDSLWIENIGISWKIEMLPHVEWLTLQKLSHQIRNAQKLLCHEGVFQLFCQGCLTPLSPKWDTL